MDTKAIKAAGRYFKSVNPEAYAMWRAEERENGRPTDIAAAGLYIYEVDPEMFDRIAGR